MPIKQGLLKALKNCLKAFSNHVKGFKKTFKELWNTYKKQCRPKAIQRDLKACSNHVKGFKKTFTRAELHIKQGLFKVSYRSLKAFWILLRASRRLLQELWNAYKARPFQGLKKIIESLFSNPVKGSKKTFTRAVKCLYSKAFPRPLKSHWKPV